MKAILKKLVVIGLLLLIGSGALGQDTLNRASTPQGGRWLSKSGLANFVSVGQPTAASELESDDGIWSGSVGFITPEISIGQNNPPIAIASEAAVFIADSLIQLEGFDPDNDPITFQIINDPVLGTLSELETGLYQYAPSVGLNPGELYNDNLSFLVNDGREDSELAGFDFQFILEDIAHEISGLTFSSGNLDLSWTDLVPNEEYFVEIQYYDLSDLSTAGFRSLVSAAFTAGDVSVSDADFSLTISVDQATNPYLFEGSQVFITTSVITPNGVGAFEAFVIDNTGSARVAASEDGQFFAFGGDQSVRENGEVTLSFYSVELGAFDVSASVIEILDDGLRGSLTSPTVSETTEFIKEWSATYRATEEIGGLDSVQFRVFNAGRNLFDTAWVEIQIIDVNDPPSLGEIASQVTQEHTPLSVAVDLVDVDNEVSVFVQSSETTLAPASYADGIVTVAPSNDFAGVISVSVVATELETVEEYVAFRRFDLEVLDVDDPPVVAAIPDATIAEDNSLTLIATATDVDATVAVFNYSVEVSDPSSLVASVSDGTITLTPLPNVNGTFEISVFANDGLGNPTSISEAEVFALDVSPVNDSPEVIQSFETQQIVDNFPDYTIDLSAYFNDVENGADLEYSFEGNQEIGLGVNDQFLTVSPNDGFSGVEDVTITASDGELSVSQIISFVYVQSAANIVAEEIDPIQLEEDFGESSLDISTVFRDLNDPNAVFQYSLTGGGFISATVSEDGIITFESQDDFFGIEKFFLFGSLSSQANFVSFDVEVSAINDAPVLEQIANAEVGEDETITGLFLGVTDVDNSVSELTIEFSSSDETVIPASGISSSSLAAGFSFTISPMVDANGSSTITASVSDGLISQHVSFVVEVLPVNDLPVVISSSIDSATEDLLYNLDVSTLFGDVDGDQLTYAVIDKPDWLGASGTSLTGTPLNEDVGSSDLTIKVDDANGGVIVETYALEVVNVNDAPTLIQSFIDQELLEDFGSLNLNLATYYQDEDGDDLVYTVASSNEAVVTTSVAESILTISEVTNGSSEVTIEANDGNGGVLTTIFLVTVTNVNDDPVVASSISDQELNEGFSATTFDLGDLFTDEDEDDVLTYIVTSSDVEVVTVSVSGSQLTLTEVGLGTATVSITASDGNGGEADFSFIVTVNDVLGLVEKFTWVFFPNPVSQHFSVDGEYENLPIRLIDLSGKVMISKMISTGEKINVDHLPNGLYYLLVDDSKTPLKMMISR